MSDYTSQYHVLYDLKPDDFELQNALAHPGGGTETIEVASGEGLVEDLFEAHLRGMAIAYKEPLANILANLANDLENSGFTKIAARVDEVLEVVAAEGDEGDGDEDDEDTETIRDEIRKATSGILNILNRADFSSIATHLYGAKAHLDGLVLDIQIKSKEKPTAWAEIIGIAEHLLSKRLLYGEGQIGNVDLEDDLSESDFKLYVKLMNDIINLVKLAQHNERKLEANEGRKREAPPSVAPKTRPEIAVWRKQLKGQIDKTSYQILQIDASSKTYSSSFISPDVQENMEKRARDIYSRHLPTLKWFFKNRETPLLTTPYLTKEMVVTYLASLGKTQAALASIEAQLRSTHSELTKAFNEHQQRLRGEASE